MFLLQSAKHSSPPAQCLSQQQLKHRVETDQEERACRSLARLAVAGSDYVLVKKPAKAAVRRDFCVLFEGYYDPVLHPYPAGAGRQFLAGDKVL